MSFTDDEELLQDFLVEAGEILEKLSEQLVELERHPDNIELLNAIFRGFHTIKGGAGFLQLDALVECCHKTENLFDILRNRKRVVDAELMDVTLQVLDTVNAMFASLQDRQQPVPATPALLEALQTLVSGGNNPAAIVQVVPSKIDKNIIPSVEALPDKQEEITDKDFEDFVSSLQDIPDSVDPKPVTENTKSIKVNLPKANVALDGVDLFDMPESVVVGKSVESVKSSSSLTTDEISDDEFESLLDSLHGKGKHSGALDVSINTSSAVKPAEKIAVSPVVKPANTPVISDPINKTPTVSGAVVSGEKDEICDEEFERLLDQLHGKSSAPSSKPIATPAEKSTAAMKQQADDVLVKASSDKSHDSSMATAKVVAKAVAPAAVVVKENKEDDEQKSADQKSTGLAGENTVRVDTQRLDEIMNMVGELVLVRNRLVRLGSANIADEALSKAIANLDVVTGDLQTSVMKTRMQPIKKVFGRFPRVVRDLARNLRKEVTLELVGEDTDLDKNLVEALADPLVHLVRNAVDHGIELPQVRESAGKSRQGTVILSAEQEGDHILLTISDDGAGMDPEKLRAKAIEKGLLEKDAADRLSDRECFELIFAPGFSTKTEISDVSGRGVGMDVVKTKIAQLNGLVEIDSSVGKGSRISIKVPLTLAIMPTLMVKLSEQIFAFPLVSVNEIFNLDIRSTNVLDGQEVIVVREKTIPLFHLKRWLVRGADKTVSEHSHVVVISVGSQRVGFVVDQLIGQEEVVIKPLGKMLVGTPGVAGATITGDGTIALILDIPSMLDKYTNQDRVEKESVQLEDLRDQSHAA